MNKPSQPKIPPFASRPNRFSRRAAIVSIGGCLAATGALQAATSTWDGGADPDLNLSAAANWSGDVAPVSGDDLVFTGAANLYPANDLDSDASGTFTVNSITFDAGAELFELSGNPVLFNGKTITNNSANLATVALQLKDTGSGFTVDGSGDLYLADINRPTGFGSNFVKNGSGTVTVANRNTSYRIVLNNGAIDWAETSGNGIASNVTVNGGTLRVTGGVNPFHFGVAVSMPNTAGTTPATISIAGGITSKFNTLNGATGSVIHNQGSTGQTATLLLRSTNTGFAGSIQDGPSGGKTAVTTGEAANQTFTFSGANTFTGNLTVPTGQTFNLTSTGSLAFKPEPAAVCNKITGAGTAALDGTFHIDLGSVGTPVSGDTWTLVDVGTLAESYGANFAVAAPFAESSPGSGTWTYDSGAGVYTFSESTGQLGFGRIAISAWNGGASPDADWSNVANWNQSPVANDTLVFDGTVQTTTNNDLDTGYDSGAMTLGAFAVGALTFPPTAGAFTLQGNAIDFAGRTLTNNSPNTQTIDLALQVDTTVGGLTVNTAAGNVVLNHLDQRNGFNAPLVKTGAGTLVVNGPLANPATFGLTLNQGTVEAASTGDLFFNGTIAAGATLHTGGASATGVIHSGGDFTVNGTLDLAEGVVEDLDNLNGSGTVTNHGASGTTSTLAIRSSAGNTFSGSVQDGASGSKTALRIGNPGGTDTGNFALSGVNTYTGSTVLGQGEASFTLAAGGSMKFKPGANGETNQITALSPQATGTVTLDGTFRLDLGAASLANGNSWTLVDAATLNETYGPTFQLVNAAYVPPTNYRVNCGNGTFDAFDEDDGYATGGGAYGNGNTIDTSAVTDPAPAEVYQSERYGNHTYTFPGLGAGASYKVRLHFAELFWGNAGQRVFDVLVNGVTVLDNYDIVAAAGSNNRAKVEEVTVSATPGGSISVQLVTVTDNAKISGIEVLPLGGGSGSNFSESGDVWTMVEGGNTWTFSEATGELSLSTGGGSNYASWASANGIPGEPASGDFDKDGLTNLIEYALGLSPTASSVPAGTHAGGAVSFAKGSEAVANGDVSWAIEESDDLGVTDAWEVVTPTINNGTTISYTLPTGKPKVFVRLLVGQD